MVLEPFSAGAGARDLAGQIVDRLRAGGLGYGDLKKALFEHYWEFFAPYRARRVELAGGGLGQIQPLLDLPRRLRTEIVNLALGAVDALL